MKKIAFVLTLFLLTVERCSAADTVNMRKYMVIDLSGGPDATEYPVSYLDSEPSGGWLDEYKTAKLVLRLVKPGKFIMRGAWVKGVREVELSHPYYIGVFEMTQAQYKLIMGKCNAEYKGDTRPMECVSWYTLRAGPDASDKLKDSVVWPESKIVEEDSFMGRIRRKTHLKGFDLPTEAQWEYAFIGGKPASSRHNNACMAAEIMKYGRYLENGGRTNAHCVVGSYLPNDLGLYDMQGNVCEWCLDFLGDLEPGTFVDPLGCVTNANDKRVLRGDCFLTDMTDKEEPSHYGYYANCWSSIMGFRIVCNIERPGCHAEHVGIRSKSGVKGTVQKASKLKRL